MVKEVIKQALADKKLEDLEVAKPVGSVTPELTKEKVEEVIPLLKEVEKNNGYLAIAQKKGLLKSQVEEIHRAMLSKIAELRPAPVEGVELK